MKNLKDIIVEKLIINKDSVSSLNYKELSIKEAFDYIVDKLGTACRYEKIHDDYYEISPGYGNVAEYTFTIQNDKLVNHNVLYFDKWHSGPGKFTNNKTLQTPEIFFKQSNEPNKWLLCKEIIDACLDACK